MLSRRMRGPARCRLHRGLSPGAPQDEQTDGFWTSEAEQERRWAKDMVEIYTKGTDK
jgi:hypothetical protein